MNYLNGLNTASFVATLMSGTTALVLGAITIILTGVGDITHKERKTLLTITAVSAIIALGTSFIHGATM